MRFEHASFRLRDMLLALTLLAGCGQILGLEDGRDQGACETTAECAPGYECRAKLCMLCASGSDCDDVSAAGEGGRSIATGGNANGGKGAGQSGATSGATTSVGEGGEASQGGAGGDPTPSGGSSSAGTAGMGGRPISLPPLPF
jgi:hypothetical protein